MDVEIPDILRTYRVVAVVGASKDPEKHAHKVPAFLKKAGFTVIPVNPTVPELFGERCYGSLLDIPGEVARTIDIVDIFRPPEEAGRIVDQALELRRMFGAPRVVWMQLGIVNEPAAERARAAGIEVVMDRCMKKESEKLGL